MKQNVGTIDRIIRLVVGLAFVFLAFYWQCWFSAIIGAILLFSAAIGWCGLYRVLGINTCKIKKFKGIMRIIFKYTIYIIILLLNNTN